MNKMTIPIASKIHALRQNEMTMLKTNNKGNDLAENKMTIPTASKTHAPVILPRQLLPAMPPQATLGMPQICLMTPAFHNQIPSSGDHHPRANHEAVFHKKRWLYPRIRCLAKISTHIEAVNYPVATAG